MTRAVFDQQMKRLSGLKFPPTRTDTHWDALRDMDAALLAAAVTRAQREALEFPAPKMLRVYAEQARQSTPLPGEPDRATPLATPYAIQIATLSLRVEREWKYYCDACSDVGWRSFTCGAPAATRQPWVPAKPCGRTHQDDYAHEWTDRCPCAATNPAIQRRQDMAARAGRREEA